MDEFRQSDELIVEREAYEAEQEMKNRKFRARNIKWDRSDVDGKIVEALLPADVEVTLEDLQLPPDASLDDIEDVFMSYLSDYYGFCHFGFILEEIEE